MHLNNILRKSFITAATIVAEVKAASKRDDKLCRPSELPIYTPDKPIEKSETEDSSGGYIEETVRSTRETITKYSKEIEAYKRVASEQFDKSKENLEGIVNYLQKEDNTLPKAGAIGIGALTGLIFGLRGGFFKRTIYATVGALGMAAVCYPKEAAEYTKIGASEGKKAVTIAYNFAYGVKKDDPPLELPSLPKLPTSLDEAWNLVKSTTSSLIVSDEVKPKELTNKKDDPK